MSDVQNIETVRAVFDTAQSLHLRTVSDNFFQELDRDFGSFDGHILVSQFSFDEPWPTWEVHPEGDEMVLLLSGDTDMVLGGEDGSETVIRVSTPGEYVVVPKGAWHTARPHAPTSMLFITPGQGTLNALTPGGDPETLARSSSARACPNRASMCSLTMGLEIPALMRL